MNTITEACVHALFRAGRPRDAARAGWLESVESREGSGRLHAVVRYRSHDTSAPTRRLRVELRVPEEHTVRPDQVADRFWRTVDAVVGHQQRSDLLGLPGRDASATLVVDARAPAGAAVLPRQRCAGAAGARLRSA